MDWIVAILALSGVLAVLSTIVTVLVEAIHKLVALRSRGLFLMLEELYRQTLVDPHSLPLDEELRGKAGRRINREAARFAREVVTLPTKKYTMSHKLANAIPLFRFLERRFDTLTKTQLVQQLVYTETGRQMLNLDRDVIERRLAHIMHQFERIGWSQTTLFGMRARFFSSGVALAFVLAANINVVDIYRHLASDNETYANTMAFLGAANDSENGFTLDEQLESVDARLGEIANELSTGDGSIQASNLNALNEVQGALGRINTQVQDLQNLGLPIGYDYFPFCRSKKDSASSEQTQTNSLDADCIEHADKEDLERIFLTRDGWFWIFSIVGTVGLLGLGAPFWFGLFAKAAVLTGRIPTLQTNTKEASDNRTKVPPVGDPTPAQMGDIFLMTAGRVAIGRDGFAVGQAIDDPYQAHEKDSIGVDREGAVFFKRGGGPDGDPSDDASSTPGASSQGIKSPIRKSIGIRKMASSKDDDGTDV